MEKRFEYFGRDGKTWTPWFNYDGEQFPYQFGRKLRNEYR